MKYLDLLLSEAVLVLVQVFFEIEFQKFENEIQLFLQRLVNDVAQTLLIV